MLKEPLVSVITPCYNGEKFLHRYFESILSQTYSNIELIFINDGSTDRTEEIALSYAPKLEEKGIDFIYIYQENSGQAAAINQGLKIFKGEYLTWPDSDDWMSDDCLVKKVEFLIKNPDCAIVLCKTAKIAENDTNHIIGYLERKNKSNGYIFEDLMLYNDVSFAPGGYMVNSEKFLSTNKRREIYAGRGGQNWQMLLPIAHEYKCGFIDDVLYYYLVRSNSHSRESVTVEQRLNALQRYEETLMQTLVRMEISDAQREKYITAVKNKYIHDRFLLAIEFNDKKMLKHYYGELKNCQQVTTKRRIQYIVFKSKIMSKVYNVFKSKKV